MLYHVKRNDQNYGPYTLEDLQKYLASGNVLPTDLAKSDEMADWQSVAQVLNIASAVPPAYQHPLAPAYPGAATPPQLIYPDPPNLHWGLVLLIGVFTCGLFSLVWTFVQAVWMRKVNPNSKALFFYIAAVALYIAGMAAQFCGAFASGHGNPNLGLIAIYCVCLLAYFILFLFAIFDMRRSMEDHFNGPEPIGLSLSGVMTFFFNTLYFQYHMSRINELKRAARYRGAAV